MITPNPFSSGSARWNIMARLRHRAARGQVRSRGARRGQDPAREDRRPAGQRPRRARRLHPGRGRRPPRLRERGDQGPGRGRGHRLRRSRRSTILIETPIAVTKDAPAAAPGLPRLHLVGRGPGDLGGKRLPAGQPEAGRPEAVPDPEGPVHDRRVRWLGQGQRRVLRRRDRQGRRRSRRNSGSRRAAAWRVTRQPSQRTAPGRASACPGSAPASAGAWSCSTCR